MFQIGQFSKIACVSTRQLRHYDEIGLFKPDVNWVHNIRATGEATFIRGNRQETVAIEEISNQDAAPILKQFLTQFGIVPFIPPYFAVDKRASLAAFEQEAKRHPVFRIIDTR